jgi:hemerythrin-like domain-containing protein
MQKDRLAMGALSSSILSKIFLQKLEHTHIPLLTEKHKLINYFRYIDNILIIFDTNHTNTQSILNDFNTIHPIIKFTAKLKRNHHHAKNP